MIPPVRKPHAKTQKMQLSTAGFISDIFFHNKRSATE